MIQSNPPPWPWWVKAKTGLQWREPQGPVLFASAHSPPNLPKVPILTEVSGWAALQQPKHNSSDSTARREGWWGDFRPILTTLLFSVSFFWGLLLSSLETSWTNLSWLVFSCGGMSFHEVHFVLETKTRGIQPAASTWRQYRSSPSCRSLVRSWPRICFAISKGFEADVFNLLRLVSGDFCTGGSVAQVVVNFAWANYGEAVLTSMYGVICAEFFKLLLVGGLNHIVCELLLCLDCCGNVWVVAYSWRQGPFLFNQLLEWLVCLALVPSSWWSGCCVAVRSAWVLVCSVCYRDHSIAVLCECLLQGLYELLFLSDASMCVFRMPCGSATSCPSPPACSGCSRRPSPVGRRHVVGASCLAQTRCQEVSVLGCFLNRGLPSRGLSMLAATICYGDVIVCAY